MSAAKQFNYEGRSMANGRLTTARETRGYPGKRRHNAHVPDDSTRISLRSIVDDNVVQLTRWCMSQYRASDNG